jgi:hypothetical protein
MDLQSGIAVMELIEEAGKELGATCGPHGAGSMTTMIDVPSFEAIEQNYPGTVR